MGKIYSYIFFIMLALSFAGLQAQDAQESNDTNPIVQDTLTISSDDPIEIVTDTLENRPNTAALYSAALPGLGQAYNKKYWKIPIIYGGGLVMGYFINYNHVRF